jgi:FO synthase subunit 1
MRLVTYSKNVFLPVTDLCRNRCGYCSFRQDPGRARIIHRSEALQLLKKARAEGCSEALFSMGESPWEVEGFRRMADLAGVHDGDMVGYLVELCELALDLGLLPHTNAGILSDCDLSRLAPCNASMGLMLETTASVPAHEGSPGKMPDLRLDFIARAGRMRIPFTTGILVGIGESMGDRVASLQAIADLHRSFGHIQEVIIQPLDPKPGTAMAFAQRPGTEELCDVVRVARDTLPDDVALQVPPNLVDDLLPLVKSGASDLGGISTVTLDWINPGRHWPGLDDLSKRLSGYDIRERLPVYPRFILKGRYGEKTSRLIEALAGEDGLRRK